MLKRLAEFPGIKWRKVQVPDEKPKQKTKKNKRAKNKKRKQKQVKLIEFHHKQSIIEEYIDSSEDYQQKERALITLGDYQLNEVKELLTKLDESEDKEPMIKTYRVITVYEQEEQNDVDDKLELYLSAGNDTLPEQLYNRHGRPYIGKKHKKW